MQMDLLYPLMIGVLAAVAEATLLGRGRRSRVTTVLLVVIVIAVPHPFGWILSNLFLALVARRVTAAVIGYRVRGGDTVAAETA